ncbi:MAG TPA: cation transporter [Candidatus Dormibacteraeota bacterium]|nr:cation transporter [Candidatus Dormibacteraeota bacterium]
MILEAVLAIGAGVTARSVLLTAFGADSVIELFSGATLAWRLHAEARGGDDSRLDSVEKRAIWISALLLVLLCIYILATSALGLVFRFEPERSWLGIVVSAAAVIVMPWLAAQKRGVNQTVDSPALRADIAESVSCAFLAAVTLAGVALNAVTGWWWVEYIAAVALLIWLVPEARETLEAAREGMTSGELD